MCKHVCSGATGCQQEEPGEESGDDSKDIAAPERLIQENIRRSNSRIGIGFVRFGLIERAGIITLNLGTLNLGRVA